tara:strand:+ start:2772 stop:2942 length:171 start_codon:yes stop_codon:yes gene_type:complete
MPKKGKVVYVKPMTDDSKLQLNILDLMTKEKKATPDMIFEGYQKPKPKPKKKKKKK